MSRLTSACTAAGSFRLTSGGGQQPANAGDARPSPTVSKIAARCIRGPARIRARPSQHTTGLTEARHKRTVPPPREVDISPSSLPHLWSELRARTSLYLRRSPLRLTRADDGGAALVGRPTLFQCMDLNRGRFCVARVASSAADALECISNRKRSKLSKRGEVRAASRRLASNSERSGWSIR